MTQFPQQITRENRREGETVLYFLKRPKRHIQNAVLDFFGY